MTRREEIEFLKEEAQLRAEISNSLEGYIDGLKRAKAVDEEIKRLRDIEVDVLAKRDAALKLRTAAGDAEAARQKNIYDLLKSQTDVLEKQNILLKDNLKTVNKTNLLINKGATSMVKAVASLPNLIEQGYGKIKGLGLFEMDKAIKKSALSMGLMTSDSKQFRSDIKLAADDTLAIGVGIEELSKYQSDYNEALGRNVMLNKEGLKAMAAMAAATALGTEGSAALAADFEQQGLSAERTKDFVEQTMNDSHKMGLNASKVIKNIQQNFKLLNKYNFKGGIKGLEKMAQTTTKLGVDMTFATGMADKLFDVEGAVDMSAQLQVMGGEWAKMSDPFHLMYMARNDMAGLTEEIGKAAQSSVHFNNESKEFEISAMEMHRLRKISEQTGIAYEDLATAAKNAAIFTKIKGQISFNADKDTKEFLANTAKFDEQGRSYIEMDIKGKKTKKFLSELDNSNMVQLKTMAEQKKTLEQYAKDSRTFDEALTNFINQLKVKLLPIIEVMNNKLIPKIDSLVKRFQDEKWGEKIEVFATKVGEWISKFGALLIDNPLTTAVGYLSSKGLGFIMEKAGWILNGLALAQGFNMGTKGGLSNIIPGGKNMRVGAKVMANGNITKGAGIMGKGLGKFAAPLAIAGLGIDAYSNFNDEKLSKGDAAWKTLDQNKFMATGAGIGAALGLAGGPFAPITVPAGMLMGSGIGGIADFATSFMDNEGLWGDYGTNPKSNDAILSGGKITPLDKKDDILAMKSGGAVDKVFSGKNTEPKLVKHEFNDLKINGEIRLTSPGNSNINIDLLKSPEFVRQITHLMQVELQRGRNQVQKA